MIDKNEILFSLKRFIDEYPVNKKGGVTRFLNANKEKIDKLLVLYNFNELLNLINKECETTISYKNAKRVFNAIDANQKPTQPVTEQKQAVIEKPKVENVTPIKN